MTTLRFRVCHSEDLALEIAAAEAWDAGAIGVEEHPGAILVYVPETALGPVREAIGRNDALRCEAPEAVEERNWSEAWKEGLTPFEVSERLVVCPSFQVPTLRPGQRRVEVDPGQAFGTGHHGSTALALRLVDEWLPAGGRVLDVGCGSGLLAIAAVVLGAREAVACDIDPLATAATRDNAERNGCAAALRVVTGSTDAVRAEGPFELVVANMIRSELAPLLDDLTGSRCRGRCARSVRTPAPRGRPRWPTASVQSGFRIASRLHELDARGDDWLGLHAVRGTPRPA